MMIGFTNGCFDLLHEGHRHYLRECCRLCSYLIVALNSDRYCREVKGEGRPVWNWTERMAAVRPLVAAVIPFEGREEKLIMEIRPDVVFKGSDHAPADFLGIRVPSWRRGGKMWDVIPVVMIERLPGISTSSEIERLGLQKTPPEPKTAPP